jgi:hypothetical protein
MILSEFKAYFREVKSASLLEITQRFAIPTDVAHEILAIWQRKGKIVRAENSSCGSRCVKCSPLLIERYQWQEGESESCQ